MCKIKFISGGGWSSSYYTDNEGKLYNASTGSTYVKDFIERLSIDVDFLKYHPDLCYFKNGINYNSQNLNPYLFEYFQDIPKWVYSKDDSKPLIPQLNEKELKELDSYKCRGEYEYKESMPKTREHIITVGKVWANGNSEVIKYKED